MKRSGIIFLLSLFSGTAVFAQEYKVKAVSDDSFSTALEKLINSAVSRFEDCTGEYIRSTWLLGDDHRLSFSFPGSVASIIRIRNNDKYAYIEFRGFESAETMEKGKAELFQMIRRALGKQLREQEYKPVSFFSFSIKDDNGYFSSKMEMFSGSSSSPVYLLGPEKEEAGDDKPKNHFILLKFYSGVPFYFHFIRHVPPPDAQLHQLLQQLLRDAAGDFDSLAKRNTDAATGKTKRSDTMQQNGYTVIMHYRGGSRTARIVLSSPSGQATSSKEWEWCRQAVEAAVGSEYVYTNSSYQSYGDIIHYFSKHGITNLPGGILRKHKGRTGHLYQGDQPGAAPCKKIGRLG